MNDEYLNSAVHKQQMEYIASTYGVPAAVGRRVFYTGDKTPRYGTIKYALHGRLYIQLDHEKHAFPFHPTWMIEYIENEESKNNGN